MSLDQPSAPEQHSLLEDLQALLSATLLIALAINLYKSAGLLTGGTAGLGFLLAYATPVSFGAGYFLINLPFYILAFQRMGWPFTLRTLCAVSLVSLLVELSGHWLQFSLLQPAYAAVLGGILMGVGMLMLFRHRASLGGVNLLVLYLQDRFGWSAGRVQMLIDCLILLAASAVVGLQALLLSVLGAVVLNLVLAFNHKAGRYTAIS
ncbi:YitT family protein [Pseudomonas sp. N040]|uniref:YitT family protein n=1 Tax=Pseudomonas sp. N040 TaxID=2785325 RepID=UPI0018A2F1A9|nr:YitT family protein [Pseudomonas sp. N040]MBF7729496.1 YitT family protein [Pseudomonas sp. N040]MBW7013136.1 YitT family protein [Pseudomonas sp. N040]